MNRRTYTKIRNALEEDDGVDEIEFNTIDTLLRSLCNQQKSEGVKR